MYCYVKTRVKEKTKQWHLNFCVICKKHSLNMNFSYEWKMEQQSGQQWIFTVLSLQQTPLLACCGPTQRVQPHDCPSLLVFRASTINSQLISLLFSPSHWTLPLHIPLMAIHFMLSSILSLVSSSLLGPGHRLNPFQTLRTWNNSCTSAEHDSNQLKSYLPSLQCVA